MLDKQFFHLVLYVLIAVARKKVIVKCMLDKQFCHLVLYVLVAVAIQKR